MWINIFGNRSFRDSSQYPVFPWLLSNHENKKFDSLISDSNNFRDLNKSANELYKLDNFDIEELRENANAKDDVSDVNTINELLKVNTNISEDVDNYMTFFEEMQSPYKNMMSHILLPELNIWKDPFL